jgi:hypothetical protein
MTTSSSQISHYGPVLKREFLELTDLGNGIFGFDRLLNLKKGSTVIFKVTDKGIFFMPCEIKEKDAYSQGEWGKIERLVAERGKSYKTAKGARRHLKSL